MLRTPFGITDRGELAELITLDSGAARCAVLTYGGALVSLEVPDREGKLTDVALGFDSVADYQRQDKFIGGLIGRYANRIADSRFSLDRIEYLLFSNDGVNHLHGGKAGFDKKVWAAQDVPNGVRLTLVSPHMDEGYPGTLTAAVTYTLEGTALTIAYEASCNRDTVCNLTNHAYFNLGGHNGGDILGHILTLHAAWYTPVGDRQCIPTGALAPVGGTPMDFRAPMAIGARIDDEFIQLRFGAGYDHNWMLDGAVGTLRPAAEVFCPDTGISMTVDTTMPGIQFYTGNHLDGCPIGKGGAQYRRRHGFCLETQFPPDAPNRPAFPQPILRAGECWKHTTVFQFGAQK